MGWLEEERFQRGRNLCKGLESSSLPSLQGHALLFWLVSLRYFHLNLFQTFTFILFLIPLHPLPLHGLTMPLV